MDANLLQPRTIFVEQSVQNLPFTRQLLDQWSSVPMKVVDRAREAVDTLSGAPDPIGAGKRSLLIAQQRGPFIKFCPGTKKYICCGYITTLDCFCQEGNAQCTCILCQKTPTKHIDAKRLRTPARSSGAKLTPVFLP